jgi:septal ring factor EnvC (AmiA/AmiB activator)
MDIQLDSITSLLSILLAGGGGGVFLTWGYMRRKAKAEAVSAEVSATKEMQDMYQQMLEDAKHDREDRRQQLQELREERDHFKNDRNELRDRLGKMEDSILEMKREVARNARKVDAMGPFICARQGCMQRIAAIISADGTAKIKDKKP